MDLLALEPDWVTCPGEGRIGHAPSIELCQGIRFFCPKCFVANQNQFPGVHRVICWAHGRSVPDQMSPGPGRWVLSGNDFHNLTLTAPPGHTSSILLTSGCKWHGFIMNGDVSILPG